MPGGIRTCSRRIRSLRSYVLACSSMSGDRYICGHLTGPLTAACPLRTRLYRSGCSRCSLSWGICASSNSLKASLLCAGSLNVGRCGEALLRIRLVEVGISRRLVDTRRGVALDGVAGGAIAHGDRRRASSGVFRGRRREGEGDVVVLSVCLQNATFPERSRGDSNPRPPPCKRPDL